MRASGDQIAQFFEGLAMLALVLERKGELNLRDFPLVEKLGPNDVRIRMRTVGICGSDVHYYTHGYIGKFIVREPMILGHEVLAKLLKLGVMLEV